MSKSALRKDKTCLNCRHVVDQKFCPNCGQENTDTRKTFHHLFIHFFEDLTHYENAFWRTIRNLLFKPAALTKEYLSGKRLSYLAPVRLYIFISFVTFLLIALFPTRITEDITKGEKEITLHINKVNKEDHKINTNPEYFRLKPMKEIDSIQKFGKEKDKLSEFGYWAYKKASGVTEHYTKKEIINKFMESFFHNIPKILFIIMPFFAFFLWIFHNKKKWYYFDHGIFTLHYFSFLLLIFLILFLMNKITSSFEEYAVVNLIAILVNTVGIVWMSYYFYPAHHRFYGETRFVSFIKSVILFFINFIFVLFILIFYILYTFINLH